MSFLTLSHISKTFGKIKVIPSLDLKVNQGEILALVGESGCGKTTILRMIAGLENSDSGHIHLNGSDISNRRPDQRKVGMVFQDLALFPHMNVAANIRFGMKSKNSQRVGELLELTDLTGLEKRFPHELSGGQQQRVAMARTLATEPDLLLLDEPFSSLDELTHEKIRTEIHQLIKRIGVTTILVTHHSIDSFMMADSVAILKKGEVLQIAPSNEIYRNPANAYTANFFGSCILLDNNRAPFGKLNMDGHHLFIRPENITLSKKEGPLSGKVVNKQFKGPHEVLIVENKAGTDQVSLETEHSDFQIGDKIYLQPQLEQIKTLTK